MEKSFKILSDAIDVGITATEMCREDSEYTLIPSLITYSEILSTAHAIIIAKSAYEKNLKNGISNNQDKENLDALFDEYFEAVKKSTETFNKKSS